MNCIRILVELIKTTTTTYILSFKYLLLFPNLSFIQIRTYLNIGYYGDLEASSRS